MDLALLLLADGRFPAGGHAHSAGVEAAIADGRVTDLADLEDFVRGRLATVGLVEASLAAATVTALRRGDASASSAVIALDAEADARIPAPPLRDASRRLGRQLVRVASRCWPDPLFALLTDLLPIGAHQPVALGVAGVAAGGSAEDVARLAVHHAVTSPAIAAVRLLGLDPFAVAALTAGCAATGECVVAEAVAAAAGAISELPAGSGPLLDIAALEHRARPIRMFAT
jgi:urease accessory protein